MHEQSLLRSLMRKIEGIAHREGALRVAEVRLRLGALAHISEEHLREHFAHAAKGGVADGARLVIVAECDEAAVGAQDIRLETIVVED